MYYTSSGVGNAKSSGYSGQGAGQQYYGSGASLPPNSAPTADPSSRMGMSYNTGMEYGQFSQSTYAGSASWVDTSLASAQRSLQSWKSVGMSSSLGREMSPGMEMPSEKSSVHLPAPGMLRSQPVGPATKGVGGTQTGVRRPTGVQTFQPKGGTQSHGRGVPRAPGPSASSAVAAGYRFGRPVDDTDHTRGQTPAVIRAPLSNQQSGLGRGNSAPSGSYPPSVPRAPQPPQPRPQEMPQPRPSQEMSRPRPPQMPQPRPSQEMSRPRPPQMPQPRPSQEMSQPRPREMSPPRPPQMPQPRPSQEMSRPRPPQMPQPRPQQMSQPRPPQMPQPRPLGLPTPPSTGTRTAIRPSAPSAASKPVSLMDVTPFQARLQSFSTKTCSDLGISVQQQQQQDLKVKKLCSLEGFSMKTVETDSSQRGGDDDDVDDNGDDDDDDDDDDDEDVDTTQCKLCNIKFEKLQVFTFKCFFFLQ